MNGKKKITVVFPNVLGGVSSFNANLVNAKCVLRKEFEIHAILLEDSNDKRPRYNGELGADHITIFKYSSVENQYYVCKRLHKILCETNGMVVCDHFLVLNTISCFKYQQTIFHLLHDYYYVQQNICYPKTIDFSIAHSSFFKDCILAWNSKDYMNRAKYIPYGVSLPVQFEKINNQCLNLVFLGRLTPMKGVNMLKKIENELQKVGTTVNWTIIGQGELKDSLIREWRSNTNVRFIEPINVVELYDELKHQDIMVFPTLFEGTPVSIFETLANGVVPIVNDLPGGIQDHIGDEIGFRVKNNPTEFAELITKLDNDRELLSKYQKNCFRYSKRNLDIDTNMNKYFNFFIEKSCVTNHGKIFDGPIFSRLDKKNIPNILVKLIRSIR